MTTLLRRWAVLFFAVTLVAACAPVGQPSESSAGSSGAGAAAMGKSSDTNPQDPATLQQGGDLRLAISALPSNFNTLNIDGNEADTGNMLKPTMPRAFAIAADGSMKVNTDYFTSVELTSTDPQVVTGTITDDDLPTLALGADPTATEGPGAQATFTLTGTATNGTGFRTSLGAHSDITIAGITSSFWQGYGGYNKTDGNFTASHWLFQTH